MNYVATLADERVVANETRKKVGISSITGSPLALVDADRIPDEIHAVMRECIGATFGDDIVGTVIDLMVSLSVTNYNLLGVEEKNVDLFKEYLDNILDLPTLLDEIFWTLYVTNNVFLQRQKGVFTYKKKSIETTIGYVNINPLIVKIEGQPWDPRTLKYIIDPSENTETIDEQDLEPKTLTIKEILHIAEKRQFEIYGQPFLRRALPALRRKKKMSDVDIATLNGLINQITLITIRDADPEEIEEVGKVLQTIGRTMTLVYDDRMKIEFIHPDIDILSPQRYEPINKAIFWALNTNSAVVEGANNYATAAVGLKLFVRRLNRYRRIVGNAITRELRKFAEDAGLKDTPIFRFRPFDLESEEFIQKILIPLRREGLISAQTTLENLSFIDFAVEKERLLKEKELQNSYDLFLPFLALIQNGRPPGSTSDNNYPEDRKPVENTNPTV